MEIKYVILIIASAFMHAFYNFLMLKAKGNRTFLTQMFIIAFIVSVIFALVTQEFHSIDLSTIAIIIGAAFFYVLYQVLVAKAYQHGTVSTNYPLTVMSPIFVPIWATIFLSETPSTQAIIGIIITVIGAIVIKIKYQKLLSISKLFTKSEAAKGAIFALSASLAYSIGSIMDKARIASISLPFYLFILLTAMTLGVVTYTLVFEREPLFHQFKTQKKLVIIGGFAMFASFFFFRDALVNLPVSLAVSVRLFSIIFGLLFGYFFLKENLTRQNWVGAGLIILGITLVVTR